MTDSEVVGKWINCKNSFGQKYQEKIGLIQKTLHQGWKKKIANLISKTDGYVKHILREHNSEADHWANVGAEGQRKVVVDKKSNADKWKAVKGFWNGNCKDNSEIGCNVVMKRVDRERWISKIEVSSESWYSHGGRNDGCVRVLTNPGSRFPQMSVCSELSTDVKNNDVLGCCVQDEEQFKSQMKACPMFNVASD